MIKVEEALNIILENIAILPHKEIPLNEAWNRVLREDIIANTNIPPFNNSAMDGYAVRSEDIKSASIENPVSLKIIDDIPAGYLPKKDINAQEASLIMTGAFMPERADCVVIVEHTILSDDHGYVKIFFAGKKGDNIRFNGEDTKKGEKVLESGILLKSSDIGLLAALGKTNVKVNKKPVVAILASGDELVDINSPLAKGKIHCSNNYMLEALVTKYGGIPVNLGIAQDTKEDLMHYLVMGKKADVIVTTGGISVGKYDVVRDTLESLGGEFKFWKVAMKPGKPLAFCVWDNKPIFGLPGNPISSMVSFEQFVRPALFKMCGKTNLSLPTILAYLENDISKKSGIRYYARCKVYIKEGKIYAVVQGPHGSNMLKPLTRSNGLIVLPEDSNGAKNGDVVEVQLIDNL
ncbi:MAG: molybdopterin molybdotransferase MoeA [Candidatus Firestonebacteria bacterium]|nr:molybdopterin molybdotransferase MoeA [Candidatus Firestonebacteria bacterium]